MMAVLIHQLLSANMLWGATVVSPCTATTVVVQGILINTELSGIQHTCHRYDVQMF